MRAKLEKIIPEHDKSFISMKLEQPVRMRPFDGVWHYHPEIEIVFVEEGANEAFIGDHVEVFGPGDLVLMGANVPHFWRGQPHTRMRAVLVQFPAEILGNSFQLTSEFKNIRQMLELAKRGLYFQDKITGRLAESLRELPAAEGWRRIFLLLEVLGMLSDRKNVRPLASSGYLPELNQKTSERINKTIKFIFDNFTRPISLSEVAGEANMTPSAFCRYFQKSTGKHLSKFINELRIGTACRLLQDTDKDISAICFEVGFGTLSNFNRLFKDVKKMSPRDYRTKLKQSVQV